jgi:DNA-binding GntR family transcriptional regulator
VNFTPKETLAIQIAQHIAEKIIRSELQPGEKIHEERLAQELGVSRSPVREALRILQKDRLVEVVPRHGARVTEMSATFVEFFFDILGELYALGARRFAENSTEEDRKRLYAALDALDRAADEGDILGYYRAFVEYAAAGLQGAKNPLLEELLRRDLDASTRRAEFAAVSVQVADLKKNVDFFKNITRYSAIEPDGEMAARTVRDFFRHEKEFVLSSLKEKLRRVGGIPPASQSAHVIEKMSWGSRKSVRIEED